MASPLPNLLRPAMASASPVAIPIESFLDTLSTTCPRRFPHLHPVTPRRISLAISGGPDSMALATLFSLALHRRSRLVIGDAKISGIDAFVINHGFRKGSGEEAERVAKELRRLDNVAAHVGVIDWGLYGFRDGREAAAAPNLEGLARMARYRLLGLMAARTRSDALFVAHHQDDVYETVLLRLLAGVRSPRGLSGIRPAGDIPECQGMFGVHRSGMVTAMANGLAYMRAIGPPGVEQIVLRRRLWWELVEEARQEIRDMLREKQRYEQRREKGYLGPDLEWDIPPAAALARQNLENSIQLTPTMISFKHRPEHSTPTIRPEEGGVYVYRPLLAFTKDQLLATCHENGASYVIDETNSDPTITTRNAIRYLAANHQLPRALQKDQILKLAADCQSIRKDEDARARWLLGKTQLRADFGVGCLSVRLPPIAGLSLRDRQRARRPTHHTKTILSRRLSLRLKSLQTPLTLLTRTLLSSVSPYANPPQLRDTTPFLPRLFPSLFNSPPSPPFSLNGLLLSTPKPGYLTLTRQPTSSKDPLPLAFFLQPRIILDGPLDSQPWQKTALWDNRFWLRPRTRLPGRLVIAPLTPQHLSTFHQNLSDQKVSTRLTKALKRAKGKSRFTLPAVYFEGSVSFCESPPAFGTATYIPSSSSESLHVSQMTLIALPSIGIALPGAEHWLECQVFFKKVDHDIQSRLPAGEPVEAWGDRVNVSYQDI